MSIIGIVRDFTSRTQIQTYGIQILAQMYKSDREAIFSDGGDMHTTLKVTEDSWGDNTAAGRSLKHILYPSACTGSIRGILEAQTLLAEMESQNPAILEAIGLDATLHSVSAQLEGVRNLEISGRLGEHFHQSPSFNKMFPYSLSTAERQSCGQKKLIRAASKPTAELHRRLQAKMYGTMHSNRKHGNIPSAHATQGSAS